MTAAKQAPDETIRIVESGPPECGPYGEIFRNRFVVFRNDPVEFPDGSRGGHVALLPAANSVGGAAILPVHQGKLVLCREFRHAIRDWQVGLPRGFAEPGETSEQAARRELCEEYRTSEFSLKWLGTMAPDSSVQSARVDIYLAELSEVPAMVGEFSETAPVVVSPGAALEKLGSGEWNDSFLAFAMLNALTKGYLDGQIERN